MTELRSQFVEKIDTLSSDIGALCGLCPQLFAFHAVARSDFSRKQKELSAARVRESKKRVESEKVFRWRDSKLSVMFRTAKVCEIVVLLLRCCSSLLQCSPARFTPA